MGIKIAALIDKITADWSWARHELHLADISLPDFLATVWRTLSVAATNIGGTGICSSIALKTIEKLSLELIPNGLPTRFEQLVDYADIRHILSGPWLLPEAIELLGNVGVPLDRCVAADIAELLKPVESGQYIQKLDFSTLILLFDGDRCDDDQAANLEVIANLVWGQLDEEEIGLATESLAKINFKSASGVWSASKDLLSTEIGDVEEEMRVRFAPESQRLADTYGAEGKAFFKRCRIRYDAPSKLLADWVCSASTDEKRQAALLYLIKGLYGAEVSRKYLREKQMISCTWLCDTKPYISDWSLEDIEELQRRIKPDINSPYSPAPPPTPRISAEKALNAIYQWWELNKEDQIAQYERKVFPGGIFPLLSFEAFKKEPEARKGWLTLFLLGAFHTIGRSNPGQHREFLQLCHTKGWMDRFVTVGQGGLNEWMDVVKSYLQDEIQDPEYYHWMKEFVSIFLLGYWLDEYKDSYLAVERMQLPFSLKQITSPRINPAFQGGGPDAPPIDRALGMGACFVMRELTRKELISNSLAHQFCYVPKRPVRDFMEQLGCYGLNNGNDHSTRSKIIYNYVCQHLGEEKATFHNSFDLPLHIVASDTDLQRQLFNATLLTEEDFEEDDEI